LFCLALFVSFSLIIDVALQYSLFYPWTCHFYSNLFCTCICQCVSVILQQSILSHGGVCTWTLCMQEPVLHLDVIVYKSFLLCLPTKAKTILKVCIGLFRNRYVCFGCFRYMFEIPTQTKTNRKMYFYLNETNRKTTETD
jgi:hypothetical protein